MVFKLPPTHRQNSCKPPPARAAPGFLGSPQEGTRTGASCGQPVLKNVERERQNTKGREEGEKRTIYVDPDP